MFSKDWTKRIQNECFELKNWVGKIQDTKDRVGKI